MSDDLQKFGRLDVANSSEDVNFGYQVFTTQSFLTEASCVRRSV